MPQITVIYYDTVNTAVDVLQRTVDDLREKLPETTIIAVPKDYDLMLDCSIDQLVTVRSLIDTAIQIKASEDSTTQHILTDSILPPS